MKTDPRRTTFGTTNSQRPSAFDNSLGSQGFDSFRDPRINLAAPAVDQTLCLILPPPRRELPEECTQLVELERVLARLPSCLATIKCTQLWRPRYSIACWACRLSQASNGSVWGSSRREGHDPQREKADHGLLKANRAGCHPEVDLALPTGLLAQLGRGVDDNRDLRRSVFGQSDAEKPRTDGPARVQSQIIEVDFAPCRT